MRERNGNSALRLGLHMAEVEQKGKIRKWTYTGCDQIFANLPNSKPDSDVIYRLVKSEYMYKNIADETFAEQARPALKGKGAHRQTARCMRARQCKDTLGSSPTHPTPHPLTIQQSPRTSPPPPLIPIREFVCLGSADSRQSDSVASRSPNEQPPRLSILQIVAPRLVA